MSQFATIRTRIKDKAILLKCLKDLGYPYEEGNNLSLYGYMGDTRSETADIVIRRKHIGSASNDIGFKKVGSYYNLIISNFDQNASKGKQFMDLDKTARKIEQEMLEVEYAIKRKYAEEKIKKTMDGLKGKGYKLRSRTEKGKNIVFEYVKPR